MQNSNFISLGELAIEMGINKSKLSWYYLKELITPDFVVGKMFLFEKPKVKLRIKKIQQLKKGGLKLNDIKLKLEAEYTPIKL